MWMIFLAFFDRQVRISPVFFDKIAGAYSLYDQNLIRFKRKGKMKTRSFLSFNNPESVVFLYFFIFILLSGGGPVAMRISFAEMPPFWMSLLRFMFGALIYGSWSP